MVSIERWAVVRRNQWQEWAHIAERAGYAALDKHLHHLLAEEPALHATATELRVCLDRTEIILSEWLGSANMSRVEEVARHRFTSRAALDRFMAWFHYEDTLDAASSLVQLAFANGTDSLGKVLDELAAQKPKRREQRRRRRHQSAG